MRPIILSGFMATGKSTVGSCVATKLSLPFIDTDEIIAREAGTSISELWHREGEANFRAREEAVVTRLLAEGAPRVIAFGGGTVTRRSLRHRALDRGIVVTLTASPTTIVSRAGDLSGRPNLLARSPIDRVTELLDQRAEAYAECHGTVETDTGDPNVVAARVIDVARRDPLVVPLGARSYTIEFVREEPARLTDTLSRAKASHLLVVTDANVRRARGRALEQALAPLGHKRTDVTLAAGEEHKTLASVATIWDAALGTGIDRDAIVVAFGGGVIGDLAGFAGATLLRGIRIVQVPTTLLAMVDASVGGKTAFDHPGGKNLIGAFHQPTAVVVDFGHLSTLSAEERTASLAEVVKIAVAVDGPLLLELESSAPQIAAGDLEAIAPIARRAVAAKIAVVRDDEREAGGRARLNLGHTVGHALEAAGAYTRYRHGEAVALGMVAEMRAGVVLGKTPGALVDRVRSLLLRLGLPTELPPEALARAWPYVAADKKRAGARLRLPVVHALGETQLDSVALSDLRAALGA
jgi:shikimate kinase/3-dehydroquinate synthase